jgi:hypothetical protein
MQNTKVAPYERYIIMFPLLITTILGVTDGDESLTSLKNRFDTVYSSASK